MIIIRKFQPSDFQWVIDIERKVFNEHDPYLYMQFYETYPDTFIVADINGFVIGYVAGFLAQVGVGRIFSLAVDPKYQNRSVGSNLLKEIINIFRKEGVTEIILEVRMDNIKAKRFYERLGFSQFGIAEKYYNDGQNARLMKLKL
ncbi:MAG: acetyltransferase (GNAT) family protein [Candidatus Methanoperedens nitroreducens]|uniref:Acetyltransferase (GNAT) family protein n=1 Tax=Candidatus Methanoperedens nitratireducens TaxID=1392998 RepID=A0A0P8DW39_9EURY|nr:MULTISPECIES: ribosomal protein S18-alanine N-acetyltransferase [Methanoperedens]KPQ41782.1 MAG: acetyltransferase (GNAT) family protein [Candidatus Methanoperedens sp. BLZ1]MCX9077035.1 ribosomal protein S18-alanine N-acetyltransferase [Candidatus Methanoperedens sp.]CAG1001450.1 diamine N-acetyltransferase [Methanosarcinales archaeon]MBZ0176474.1 ribosomal protein S18-alanine N-acetyltransferase [Candidatus Methanoperedens nitroreducens]MCX9088665.1 ribosomal protein S18-alanine N-acetylt